MRSIILIVAILGLAACQAIIPHEPIVQASGAGVTETWSAGAAATAAPVVSASGAGMEAHPLPAQATAKEKRK